jgi:hypothetical protein
MTIASSARKNNATPASVILSRIEAPRPARFGAGLDAGGFAVGGGDFGGGGGVAARLVWGEAAVAGGRMTGMGCVGTSSVDSCARQAGICRVGSASRGRWGAGAEGGTWMRRVAVGGGVGPDGG